ncbi:transcriptional regulator [Oscillibacter sp.]|uniref:transcriptional regulator n=1 Tax=Oscillibacter sp. TaxID=1945593 RepID=UPI002D7EC762|nr:transcriptional regulator [Oscillibacter sp.]
MIFIEDERIKLNGVVLPGLVKSIEVTETAKVDEQEVEGSATKPKQATGYEDAKVNIELIIDDTEGQTKYERYAVLREIFRKPGQNVPQPIPIVSEDTAAHGIEKVIFKKLTHKGENKKSQLVANLELWEYIPQTITATSSSGGSGSSGGLSGGGSSQAAAATSNLNQDYQQYLGTKRGKSPASDMVTGAATAALNKVMTQMPY